MNSSRVEDMCGMNVSSTSVPVQPNNGAYIFVTVILAVLIGFGNTLVLAAFGKFQELQTSVNVFVVSLALADLVVALIALPMQAAGFIFPPIETVEFVCLFRFCFTQAACGTSILTLLLISVDRYLAIEKPLKYNILMTTRRAKLLSIGAWVFSFSYNFIPMFGWNSWSPCGECITVVIFPRTFHTILMLLLLACILSVAVVNMKIFFTANRIYKDIQKRVSSFPEQTFTDGSSNNKNVFAKNMRAAKTLVLVFGVFTLCVLPYCIFTLWETHSYDKEANIRNTQLRSALIFLVFVNSGFNPIIYNRRFPEFNRAFRKLLHMKPRVETT